MQVLTIPDESSIRAARHAGEFFWLDLADPDDALIERVGACLDWHPLLVEDLQHGKQRPKVEDFADHALIVMYAVGPPPANRDELRALEHLLVVHGDYLVTVRPAAATWLDDLRENLPKRGRGLTEGGLVHRVLDLIVDTTTDASKDVSEEVSGLEEAIDRGATELVLARLRAARRYVTELHGLVGPQRDALANISGTLEAIPGFEVSIHDHFRDVTDHARRAVDLVNVSNRLLDGAFEAYYTMLVAQQGAVTQRLTVISTIFLPLTFVTGFFGQNFVWMVDQVDTRRDFLLFGVGTTTLTALLLALLFRRLRWF